MTTNDNSATGNLMRRVQKVSAALKSLFLIAAVGTALISVGATVSLFKSFEGETLEDTLDSLIWTAIYWCAYKLFRQCSRGNFFSVDVARGLRRIGELAIALGLVDGVVSFASRIHEIPLWSNLLFFPCISFSVVPGIAFLCIAWIMDEGRKVREEQALTI